jgi:hypothetical protein
MPVLHEVVSMEGPYKDSHMLAEANVHAMTSLWAQPWRSLV